MERGPPPRHSVMDFFRWKLVRDGAEGTGELGVRGNLYEMRLFSISEKCIKISNTFTFYSSKIYWSLFLRQKER